MKPIAIIAVGALAASGAFAFARVMDAVMPDHGMTPRQAGHVERLAVPAPAARPVLPAPAGLAPVVIPETAPEAASETINRPEAAPAQVAAVRPVTRPVALPSFPAESLAAEQPPVNFFLAPDASPMAQPPADAPVARGDFHGLSVSGVYR